jgi:hypothetical protein
MNKTLPVAICLYLASAVAVAAEVAGVFIDDKIETESGQPLTLNGAGLREKFWIDVYVGSLYLPQESHDVAEILSKPGPWRMQLDFVYKEVAREKLLDSWHEGFEKNQGVESMNKLRARIDRFYGFFDSSAVAGDQYRFDYAPASGTLVSKNGQLLGLIPGEDFSNALLEIWLGNHPADKSLKKDLLGL